MQTKLDEVHLLCEDYNTREPGDMRENILDLIAELVMREEEFYPIVNSYGITFDCFEEGICTFIQ